MNNFIRYAYMDLDGTGDWRFFEDLVSAAKEAGPQREIYKVKFELAGTYKIVETAERQCDDSNAESTSGQI